MKKWLRWTLVALFGAVFLVSAFMLGRYYLESKKQNDQFDELARMVERAAAQASVNTTVVNPAPSIGADGQPEENADLSAQPLPQYVEVSALNRDMVGWIRIEGTKINYPVMQTPDDPEYYLYKDFYGQYSGHGCIFADGKCNVVLPSDNVTLYGHNMKDGSMFNALRNYRTKSYWQSHRYITFDTLTHHREYEIFAVFTTTASKGKGFDYHNFVYADSREDYDTFVEACREMSLYDTGVIPTYGDKLITLSTCEYSQRNGRLVVVARSVN